MVDLHKFRESSLLPNFFLFLWTCVRVDSLIYYSAAWIKKHTNKCFLWFATRERVHLETLFTDKPFLFLGNAYIFQKCLNYSERTNKNK